LLDPGAAAGFGFGDVGRRRSLRRRERLAGRGAGFGLGERLGRLEERPLDGAVGVEQVVAAVAQLLELRRQQRAATTEVGEDALAQRLRLLDHLAALDAGALDDFVRFLL